MAEKLKVLLQYYGISPWEIEVLYGFLNSHFDVIQDEIEPDEPEFVSVLEIRVPLAFNEAFFEWFTFKKWEKIKGILKEMKRRRGSSNALRVRIKFAGSPRITFLVDSREREYFDNAVEKMDFVLELLPYHLDPQKLPADTTELSYVFDVRSAKWRQGEATGNKRYLFVNGTWKMI
ncbi:MAG: hypothetical protein D9C04_00420 [Nitrosopumilus sp. B06]|nr:MAG: hypothetical protein D9C04_00420 [Nitrosopumilus sp. B06]